MDWANEPYVRLYTRETDDDLLLSWEAIALWHRMLTRFDRSGLLVTRRDVRGLAALFRMPVDVVTRAELELLEDGRIQRVTGGYFAPNFLEAQEANKSDKLRQRESRARRRDALTGHSTDGNNSEHVTKRDSESRNVARCHELSQPVTLTYPDPNLSRASRDALSLDSNSSSSTRSDTSSEAPQLRQRGRSSARDVSQPLPDGWKPSSEAVELARELGVDPAHELAQFVDYARAKGLVAADWNALFRKWCRGSRDKGKQQRSKPKPGAYTTKPREHRQTIEGRVYVERNGTLVPVSDDEPDGKSGAGS